jgi:hypothetical protein
MVNLLVREQERRSGLLLAVARWLRRWADVLAGPERPVVVREAPLTLYPPVLPSSGPYRSDAVGAEARLLERIATLEAAVWGVPPAPAPTKQELLAWARICPICAYPYPHIEPITAVVCRDGLRVQEKNGERCHVGGHNGSQHLHGMQGHVAF